MSYRIDVSRSRFVVNTEATGMSSMFGHDHKLNVGDYAGEVNFEAGDPATASLALSVQAASVRASGALFLQQRDFKVPPFSFAGGSVTVADRVTLSFIIVATRIASRPPSP